MLKRFKKFVKNQKGLTLVELLAVVVILGIIAAVAVPSIGGVIENSKKDAHIANAKQVANAAKLAHAQGITKTTVYTVSTTNHPGYTIQTLIDEGYLDTFNDPDGGLYDSGFVEVDTTTSTKKVTYKIYLEGTKREVGESNAPVEFSALSSNDVQIKD